MLDNSVHQSVLYFSFSDQETMQKDQMVVAEIVNQDLGINKSYHCIACRYI